MLRRVWRLVDAAQWSSDYSDFLVVVAWQQRTCRFANKILFCQFCLFWYWWISLNFLFLTLNVLLLTGRQVKWVSWVSSTHLTNATHSTQEVELVTGISWVHVLSWVSFTFWVEWVEWLECRLDLQMFQNADWISASSVSSVSWVDWLTRMPNGYVKCQFACSGVEHQSDMSRLKVD